MGESLGGSAETSSVSSEAQSRDVTDADWFFTLSLDLMCIASAEGQFLRLNPAFERTLGFTMQELLERPFLDFIHPDDRPATLDVMGTLSQGAELVNFENRYRCKDGSFRSFSWTCAPRNGLFYATARDITERVEAAREIQQLNAGLERRVAERTEALAAANRELEAFSYSIAHDLRAPLRGIDSFSRMVIEDYGPKLDAEGQRQLNVIGSEAQRMGRLIDELLNFSRLGRLELRPALVDMESLVRTVIDELPITQAHRIAHINIGSLPPALGDRAMLRQVWVNLISNALKFSDQSEVPAIEISGEARDGFSTYRVTDHGVGFEPRYAAKLFGVFQRLHSETEFEGTGVGLAIVQRIVHRHAGTVAAEGAVNRGATISFTIPNTKGTEYDGPQ